MTDEIRTAEEIVKEADLEACKQFLTDNNIQ